MANEDYELQYSGEEIDRLLGLAATSLQGIPSEYLTREQILDAIETALSVKVDKEEGKGLSSNDYTSEEKDKLSDLPTSEDLYTMFLMTSLRRLKPFLYDISYDEIDYEYAKKRFDHGVEPNIGACSVLRYGSMIGRNFDWKDDYQATFIVRTKPSKERHAVIGCGGMSSMTTDVVDSRQLTEDYRLLPFMLVDGMNDSRLFAEMNVVPYDGFTETAPSIEVRERISAVMLVRYILDNFSGVSDALDYIGKYVQVYQPQNLTAMGYGLHYFVKDESTCFALEFDGDSIVTIDTDIMTNFHLNEVTARPDGSVWTNIDANDGNLPTSIGIERYGSGLERFNILNAQKATGIVGIGGMQETMSLVNFSKAYTNEIGSDFWYSEFVGLSADGTTDIDVDTNTDEQAFVNRINAYKQKWDEHTKESGDVWITSHSCVYDTDNLCFHVKVQEEDDVFTVYFDQKQDRISDLEEIREGASLGSTAYQKPQTGIPASDLAPGVIPTSESLITISEYEAIETKELRIYYVARTEEGKLEGRVWRMYVGSQLIGEFASDGSLTLPKFPMRFPFRLA